MVAFLVSAFLMVFAHAALYAFFSLFLERHGYGTTAIGAIWGVGVAAEIALFMMQRRLFDRASPMRLLAFSFLVCGLRFAMVAASDGALWVLLWAQVMHAATFGLHHSASMAVLHRWFEPAQQAVLRPPSSWSPTASAARSAASPRAGCGSACRRRPRSGLGRGRPRGLGRGGARGAAGAGCRRERGAPARG